jgi:hypothetical protein
MIFVMFLKIIYILSAVRDSKGFEGKKRVN